MIHLLRFLIHISYFPPYIMKKSPLLESFMLSFSFSFTCYFHSHHAFQENKINFFSPFPDSPLWGKQKQNHKLSGFISCHCLSPHAWAWRKDGDKIGKSKTDHCLNSAPLNTSGIWDYTGKKKKNQFHNDKANLSKFSNVLAELCLVARCVGK